MTVLNVGNRNTASPKDFELRKSSDRSPLLIDKGTKAERFAIELTIGENWSRSYGKGTSGMVRIADEGVTIGGNESIVVEVAERIGVPHNMYGLVIPTGSLFLDRGVIIAAAKIEPSFNDKLKLRLVNTTKSRIKLAQGTKVASAIFFSTEVTEFEPEFQKKAVVISDLPRTRRRIWSWIKANPQIMVPSLLSFLSSSLVTGLAFYFLLPPRTAAVPPRRPVQTSVETSRNQAAAGQTTKQVQ